MNTDYTYNLLRKDFADNKQIVLFVGAGINYSSGHEILWNDVMEHLFSSALNQVASDKCLDIETMSTLKKMFHNGSPNLDTSTLSLMKYTNNEFPAIFQAYIVKKTLGARYIPMVQNFIYERINYEYIKKSFELYQKKATQSKATIKKRKVSQIRGLYEIARLVLLSPNIKAIVTYNYDNFITQAINIIQANPKYYFNSDEMRMYKNNVRLTHSKNTKTHKNNKIVAIDIFGDKYNQTLHSGEIPIYHVHGYIPPKSEIQQIDTNSIILSLDEFYDNIRNVYSWQTDTQMHFLSHYTCIFVGSSISDITIQRMLYNAQLCGNNDRIYCFQAYGDDKKDNSMKDKVKRTLYHIKQDFFKEYGLSMISVDGKYDDMYDLINKLL